MESSIDGIVYDQHFYKAAKMRKNLFIFKSLVSVIILIFATSSFSVEVSKEDFQKMQSEMSSLKHLSLDFDQTRFRSLRNKKTLSKGKAFFSYPSKFVWNLEKSDYSWVYDGKSLMHYDKSKKTAVVYGKGASKGRELRNLIALVTRFDQLQKDYNIHSIDQTGSTLNVKMTPKRPSADLESVEIKFNIKQSHISFLKLNFAGGNYSSFKFYGASKKQIPDSAYKLPSGTKVTSAN